MFNKVILSVLCLLFSSNVVSKAVVINGHEIEVGPIVVNGSGCPAGTVTATATDDNENVVLLFSNYRAITNDANPVALSDCNIALPLSVEPGLSVGIVDIDWRGTVVSAQGSFINFHREYFFSGSQGPNYDSNWNSAGFQNFFLNDDPVFAYYSECNGEPLIARADTVATVVGADSLFSLRSADVEARLILHVEVIPCE
ncbi:DUF4360 domain-containing protein [uncultured Microbulbifer sp.]|uniref:DUF4360 domain-containing protein n=1 Tax=uncultured Microbulbifer sp. TaxID=348147 RepID=UPI002602E2FD|nr:DUF4360 domain-containing protein [uncultured Microbulbifer sp.]